MTIPDGGGGYTVTLATFDFDELDYMPEAIGSANYPTSYGVVNGAFYLISGTIYFVPDEPFPLAPAETASTSDVDLRIYGTSSSQTISAPDGDGYVILSGPDASGSGTGSDTIYGGTGDDHIYVGDGDDTVHAGDGDDIIGGWNDGGTGTNLLDGQAGDDQIVGGSGNDTIIGGTGDDFLSGGAGSDTLSGGEGSDTFWIEGNDDQVVVVGGETGSDVDHILFANDTSTSPVVVRFTGDEQGTYSYLLTGAYGSFSEIEAITGTDHADQINASQSTVAQSLAGGGGHDYLQGGMSGDTIYGGSGNDTIIGEGYAATGANLIANGSFEDTTGMTATVYGDMGSGTVPGWTEANGYDIDFHSDSRNGIVAQDGAHWLDMEGYAGQNLRIGQNVAGIQDGETYIIHVDVADFLSVQDNTSDDNQVQIIWNGVVVATINPPDGSWETFEFVVVGGSGDATNRLEFAGAGFADAMGVSFDNVEMHLAIPTSDADDRLIGGTGDDTIAGGDGGDLIQGNEGTNTLAGGGGDDTFEVATAQGGTDTIRGGEATETLGDTLRFVGTDAATIVFATLESGTYTAGTASGSFADIERFEGTGAHDILDFRALGTPLTITLDGIGSGTVTDGTATVHFSNIDEILASDEDDIIDASADAGGMTLHGRGGDDLIIGSDDNDRLEGGTGDDTITGGGGDDIFVYSAGDGTDTITDFNAGNTGPNNDGNSANNDFVNLSAFYDTVWELRADQADDGILNQSNDGVDGVDYSDNTGFGTGSLTFAGATSDSSFFTAENTGVACFVKGTLILTPRGERRIEDLQPGDLVLTADNGPKAIGWIGRQRLGRKRLAADPHLKPIRIAPSLLGSDRPLVVSPQHGILLQEGRDETLVRARHLAEIHGTQARVLEYCEGVTYFHLLFDGHEIIFANGARSESFYPGEQSIGALSQEARAEIAAIFPALAAQGPSSWDHARDWLGREGLSDDLRALLPG
ncbi:Hint domain-containing protein [uncultured Maritimibacter sp.]|uniref:Hint domain-containing protein n=1 Tax=uncultured Maritimibacter sp. TaxID=991866 RepID=UPI000AF41BC8|nr:Hint domain-containing protein [uncultured Maritimibacter sp.]